MGIPVNLFCSRHIAGFGIFWIHLKAWTLFQEQGDVRGLLLACAHLTEAVLIRGQSAIPTKDLLAITEELLQSPAAKLFSHERAYLMGHLGSSLIFLAGDLRKAYWLSHEVSVIAEEMNDIYLQIISLMYCYASLGELGEFSQAATFISKVESLLQQYPTSELQAAHLLFPANFYIMRGLLDKTAEALQEAAEMNKKHNFTYLLRTRMVINLWLNILRGEHNKAALVAQGLTFGSSLLSNKFTTGCTLFLSAINFYHQKRYLKAQEKFLSMQKIFSSNGEFSKYFLDAAKIVMGVIASHLDQQSKEQEQDLLEVLEDHHAQSPYMFLLDASLALALLQYRQGKVEESARHVQVGIKILENLEISHHLILSAHDIASACILALKLQLPAVEEYAAHLLKTSFGGAALPELEELAADTNPHIAGKAQEILEEMHRASVPQLRIQTLGTFRLWRGDILITEKEWEGRQPRLLLKAIIAHGPEGVLKDLVAEDIWPEKIPDAQFRVNLHRLRKTLEPTIHKTFGSSYLHFSHNWIELNKSLCLLDVDEFLALYKQGIAEEQQGNIKLALSRYEDAAKLYHGDFLAQDLYAHWAEARRQDLRNTYIDILFRKASLYEKRRIFQSAVESYKTLIRVDPLFETAYQRLMLLYHDKDMRSAAVRVFADCTHQLRKKLDVGPDKLTMSIYRKIKGAA